MFLFQSPPSIYPLNQKTHCKGGLLSVLSIPAIHIIINRCFLGLWEVCTFVVEKKEIYYEISCRIFDVYLSWCC